MSEWKKWLWAIIPGASGWAVNIAPQDWLSLDQRAYATLILLGIAVSAFVLLAVDWFWGFMERRTSHKFDAISYAQGRLSALKEARQKADAAQIEQNERIERLEKAQRSAKAFDEGLTVAVKWVQKQKEEEEHR